MEKFKIIINPETVKEIFSSLNPFNLAKDLKHIPEKTLNKITNEISDNIYLGPRSHGYAIIHEKKYCGTLIVIAKIRTSDS